MEHMLNMPDFKACDALSTITESTKQGDDGDSDGSFENVEGATWKQALRTSLTNTAAMAKAAGTTAASGSGGVNKTRLSKKNAKAKAKGSSTAAASSSKGWQ